MLESAKREHGDINVCVSSYNHLDDEYHDCPDPSVTIRVTTPYQKTEEEVCVIIS